MRWRQAIWLAAAMMLMCHVATAGEKQTYFGKSTSQKVVRPVSFGPEFGDRGEAVPVPRIDARPGPRLAASSGLEVPLLLAPTTGGAVLAPPPPAPAPGMMVEPAVPYLVAEPELPAIPAPIQGASVSLLYPRVRYKDLDNIAPGAVPMIVAVADPCRERGCVYVRICVPPNCVPRVKCKKGGREVQYKYGEYEVEIKSKDGLVTVDYDD